MQYYYECEPECQYCVVFNKGSVDRFWSKVKKTNDCWVWTGFIDVNGYGKFSYFSKTIFAHRFSKSMVEKLDDKKEIDHLCRNRACVNPKHLEQVSHLVNVMRSPIAAASVNRKKTLCKNGHKLVPKPNGKGRYCKPCSNKYKPERKEYMRKYMREYQRRRRLAISSEVR